MGLLGRTKGRISKIALVSDVFVVGAAAVRLARRSKAGPDGAIPQSGANKRELIVAGAAAFRLANHLRRRRRNRSGS